MVAAWKSIGTRGEPLSETPKIRWVPCSVSPKRSGARSSAACARASLISTYSPLYRTAPSLVSSEEREALRLEASRLSGDARTNERYGFQLVDGVQLLSPARNRSVADGDVRCNLHTLTLVDRLLALLGRHVKAIVSSYLYYGRDDFLGLHIDQRLCQLTVLVLLDGDAGPLILHPELCDIPGESLLRYSQEHWGHPPGGTAVHLQDGPLVLQGALIPHHRPPHKGDGEITLAAFCYL